MGVRCVTQRPARHDRRPLHESIGFFEPSLPNLREIGDFARRCLSVFLLFHPVLCPLPLGAPGPTPSLACLVALHMLTDTRTFTHTEGGVV